MRHLLKCTKGVRARLCAQLAWTLGLWICLCVAVQAADSQGGNAAAPPPAPKAVAAQPEGAVDVAQSAGAADDAAPRPADEILNDLVSLDFRDASLQDVLRLITKKSGLNIIMNPAEVKGKVTLRLENVRLGVALDEILRVNGLARLPRTENNIVRVVTAKAAGIKDVETVTEVITLNFASSSVVASFLKDFMTEGIGKVVADGGAATGGTGGGGTNSIIITDTPAQIETIKNELLPKIDKQQLQVLIEMRLVEMTEKALRNLGSQLTVSRPDSTNTSQMGAVSRFVPATAAIPALYGPDGVTVIRQAVPAVAAHYEDAAAGTGLLTATGNYVFPANQFKSVSDIGTLADPQLGFGKKIAIFGKDFNLSALFQMKEERDSVEVLAQPRVVTLNNLPAGIEITRQVPYVKEISVESGTTGGAPATQKIDFLTEGITINTTPVITENGYVRIDLTTDQKINTGSASLGGQSTPVIDERKAKASILVRTEETAMLGGLRQFTQTRTTTGIPWFHRIPVIGWLFKSNNTNQQKNDLYLFVTPSILDHPELTVDEKGLYDRIDRKAGVPDYYGDDVSAPGDIMN